jgi:hypothetical protein
MASENDREQRGCPIVLARELRGGATLVTPAHCLLTRPVNTIWPAASAIANGTRGQYERSCREVPEQSLRVLMMPSLILAPERILCKNGPRAGA